MSSLELLLLLVPSLELLLVVVELVVLLLLLLLLCVDLGCCWMSCWKRLGCLAFLVDGSPASCAASAVTLLMRCPVELGSVVRWRAGNTTPSLAMTLKQY